MPFWNKGQRAWRMKESHELNPDYQYAGEKSAITWPVNWECYKPSSKKTKPLENCDKIPKPIVTEEEDAKIKTNYYSAFPWFKPGYYEARNKGKAKLDEDWRKSPPGMRQQAEQSLKERHNAERRALQEKYEQNMAKLSSTVGGSTRRQRLYKLRGTRRIRL